MLKVQKIQHGFFTKLQINGNNLVLGQNPRRSGLSNNHDGGLDVTSGKVGVDTAVDDVLKKKRY